MTQSIFGALARPPAPRSNSPLLPWAATPPPPARRLAAGTVAPPGPPHAASWDESPDTAMLAILEAPVAPDETIAAGFDRKEAELRHLLARMGVFEARALQRRLSQPKDGDQLAHAFRRMTADRRSRLINFLADVRRREAMKR